MLVSSGGLTGCSCCSFLLFTLSLRCGRNKDVKITLYSLAEHYALQKNRGVDRKYRKTPSCCFNQGLHKGNVANENGFSDLKSKRGFRSFKCQGGPDREVPPHQWKFKMHSLNCDVCSICVCVFLCVHLYTNTCVCVHIDVIGVFIAPHVTSLLFLLFFLRL